MASGRLAKAGRGELALPLPAGYDRTTCGEVALDPDEQVRAVVRLIFDKFDELGSAWAVLRYLHRAGIDIGYRPKRGPQRGTLVWARANLPAGT